MPVIQIEAQLTSEELLNAVGQLSAPELQRFVVQVLALQAQRKAASVPEIESELLSKISRGATAETQQRYRELIARRQEETLTPEEYRELHHLTEEMEKIEAHRIGCLAELALLRNLPLTTLMAELGIQSPDCL